MSTRNLSSVTLVTIGSDNPLVAQDLAHACGADLEWVVQLVEYGIVEGAGPASLAQADDWRFFSADLQNALEVSRLQRDFGVGLEVAALILDLQHEVRRLKAALNAQRR